MPVTLAPTAVSYEPRHSALDRLYRRHDLCRTRRPTLIWFLLRESAPLPLHSLHSAPLRPSNIRSVSDTNIKLNHNCMSGAVGRHGRRQTDCGRRDTTSTAQSPPAASTEESLLTTRKTNYCFRRRRRLVKTDAISRHILTTTNQKWNTG